MLEIPPLKITFNHEHKHGYVKIVILKAESGKKKKSNVPSSKINHMKQKKKEGG